jgi:hypothetical protein
LLKVNNRHSGSKPSNRRMNPQSLRAKHLADVTPPSVNRRRKQATLVRFEVRSYEVAFPCACSSQFSASNLPVLFSHGSARLPGTESDKDHLCKPARMSRGFARTQPFEDHSPKNSGLRSELTSSHMIQLEPWSTATREVQLASKATTSEKQTRALTLRIPACTRTHPEGFRCSKRKHDRW